LISQQLRTVIGDRFPARPSFDLPVDKAPLHLTSKGYLRLCHHYGSIILYKLSLSSVTTLLVNAFFAGS
jgi:hypothetical protein